MLAGPGDLKKGQWRELVKLPVVLRKRQIRVVIMDQRGSCRGSPNLKNGKLSFSGLTPLCKFVILPKRGRYP
jgi:hypothetical protein